MVSSAHLGKVKLSRGAGGTIQSTKTTKSIDMKKLFIYSAIALVGLLASCKKDEVTGPEATNLDPATITTHSVGEGVVTLKWATPDAANYKYIEVKYRVPGESEDRLRLASVHSDTIRIENLLAAYGDVEYRLTPVTKGGKRGTTQTYKAQCLPVPERTDDVATKLPLKATELWSNAPEPSEGPIANLVDGNTGTYFHTQWSGTQKDLPHYIVAKLPTEVAYKVINITYTNRSGGNHSAPKNVEVLVSKEFDGTTFNPEQFGAVQIGTEENLKPGNTVVNKLPNYTLNDTYNYLWFKVTATTGNTKFFSMGEFEVFRHKITIFNPETGERREI